MSRTALTVAFTALFAAPAAAEPAVAQLFSPVPQAQPSTCHLTYGAQGNGPLMQHVKVFDIFYSPGNANVTKLGDYDAAVTQSKLMDMLQEYNTNGYTISRGSYIGKFEDTNPNPATVTTVDPQAYLQGLLQAGNKLPAPDNDTL